MTQTTTISDEAMRVAGLGAGEVQKALDAAYARGHTKGFEDGKFVGYGKGYDDGSTIGDRNE